MKHAIPEEQFGPLTRPMAKAVEACVHCGFCLAACPTYRELGQEMDSPRGRIVLMKQVLEGALTIEEAQPHVDRCLGCLACEPACPSGVPYRDLISPYRAVARAKRRRSAGERIRTFITSQTLPYAGRLRFAARVGSWFRFARPLLPSALRPMFDLLPPELPPRRDWPGVYPVGAPTSTSALVRAVPAGTPARPGALDQGHASGDAHRLKGERRARVALLTGCAQDVFDPGITAATLAVLSHHGVEVVIPQAQGCCGGLAWHTGDLDAARGFARRNLDAFPADVDAIITTAAGCGSAMHEYGLILAGTADAGRAVALASRVQDVCAFLGRLDARGAAGGFDRPVRIAYHDACHLANAQGVRASPRELLREVGNLELVELTDPHLCCGSAGTYNLDQPAIAASLGRQKVGAVIATGAEVVVSGNIGCLMQLRAHLREAGSSIRALHTVEVLAAALARRIP